MKKWKKILPVADLPLGSKGCIKVDNQQIALVHYEDHAQGTAVLYAVQNRCPHQNQNVLSRGLLGDQKGEPKLVCPLHKHAFSLKTGQHLGGDDAMTLKTYPIKQEEGYLFIEMEAETSTDEQLDIFPTKEKIYSTKSQKEKITA